MWYLAALVFMGVYMMVGIAKPLPFEPHFWIMITLTACLFACGLIQAVIEVKL